MLKNIFEGIIGIFIVLAVALFTCEAATAFISRCTAQEYVRKCEELENLPIDADYYIERTGLLEYETTIYADGLSGIICNKHSETVSMFEIVSTLLED